MRIHLRFTRILLPLLLLLSSCAAPVVNPPKQSMLAYRVQGEGLLAEEAPVFVVEKPELDYNRIGAPTLKITEDDCHTVTIDPSNAHIFAEKRSWQGELGRYTNLIYRIHFLKVPLNHLTAGPNGGLLILLTLNEQGEPVLVTTLHTCGCYLSFIPTSFLAPSTFPSGWDTEGQEVYGEYLPGLLNYTYRQPDEKLHILIGDGTHRVTALWLEQWHSNTQYQLKTAQIHPLGSLSHLQTEDGTFFSFFDREGPRKDYVTGSRKIWEKLFISWWALDPYVGEDKRLGRDITDGPVFYTSLKPWARQESDLRDFASFLKYWGWKL